MKKLLPLLALALVITARAATADPAGPAAPATTNVNVPTTAADLASGYAGAITQMSLKSLVIYVRGDGKIVAIKGIRSAKALDGVLLITFSAGDMMAINAEHVVMITDGARTP
jgi:hypothetical protein